MCCSTVCNASCFYQEACMQSKQITLFGLPKLEKTLSLLQGKYFSMKMFQCIDIHYLLNRIVES
mgnify:CR=1 FL=1